MKAILLAGGIGSRLFPATNNLSKQLLPVFDKPMFYYPLSSLLQAQIREVLIITTPEDKGIFQRMLGDGSQLGMIIEYAEQLIPNGIAKAFEIGESFIAGDSVCLILGDNLFLGDSIPALLQRSRAQHSGATVFGYAVNDPERYGVVEFDHQQNVLSIEEKPAHPKSNIAVTGLYFYDADVVEVARTIEPSARGEYEITAVNQEYLQQGRLKVELLNEDVDWFDAGTHHSLLTASARVSEIQAQSARIISCPEMLAYQNGWITQQSLMELVKTYPSSAYREFLENC